MHQVAAVEDERGGWSRSVDEPEVYAELDDQGRSGYDCVSEVCLKDDRFALMLELPGVRAVPLQITFNLNDKTFGQLAAALGVMLGERTSVEL